MRGDDRCPDAMFSYIRPEQRVPADHPLRPSRDMVDRTFREISPEFARLYPKTGRPSPGFQVVGGHGPPLYHRLSAS